MIHLHTPGSLPLGAYYGLHIYRDGLVWQRGFNTEPVDEPPEWRAWQERMIRRVSLADLRNALYEAGLLAMPNQRGKVRDAVSSIYYHIQEQLEKQPPDDGGRWRRLVFSCRDKALLHLHIGPDDECWLQLMHTSYHVYSVLLTIYHDFPEMSCEVNMVHTEPLCISAFSLLLQALHLDVYSRLLQLAEAIADVNLDYVRRHVRNMPVRPLPMLIGRRWVMLAQYECNAHRKGLVENRLLHESGRTDLLQSDVNPVRLANMALNGETRELHGVFQRLLPDVWPLYNRPPGDDYWQLADL